MASLLILRRRIRVASNIAKTTRAMQMVAASKMRRAQESAVKGRPYSEKLAQAVANLVGRVEDYLHSYITPPSSNDKVLMIIVSPDKGLCGALISNLLRELINFPDFKKAKFITLGKKLAKAARQNLVADFSGEAGQPSFSQIPPIVSIIDEGLLNKDWEKVYVLYAKFISFFTQKASIEQVVPIETNEVVSAPNYVFEPNVGAILNSLLPHYLESKLYQIVLEGYASEQAARMLAMQNATENAKEVIKLLTLEYNKVRQAKITNEILDNARASLALAQT